MWIRRVVSRALHTSEVGTGERETGDGIFPARLGWAGHLFRRPGRRHNGSRIRSREAEKSPIYLSINLICFYSSSNSKVGHNNSHNHFNGFILFKFYVKN